MICISIDVDWAPDQVLEDTLLLLQEYDLPATVFSTHEDGLSLANHERAIHPNFIDDQHDEEKILRELVALYPEAVGTRSHQLYTHSAVRSLYREFDLVYESNYLMYGQEGLEVFKMPQQEVFQVPIYFGDYPWLRLGGDPPEFSTMLSTSGLQVLYFHPVHIFLNTPSIDFYQQHKEHYEDPTALKRHRHDGYGVRELFLDILEYVDSRDLETSTIKQVVESQKNL